MIQGLWNRHSQQRDFPGMYAYFSDIIGSSHSSDFKLWNYGTFASDGLKYLAERGITTVLESEMKRKACDYDCIINVIYNYLFLKDKNLTFKEIVF